MARWLIALSALAVAGSAQAQTNTTCRNNGYGVVNCTTSAPPPVYSAPQYNAPQGGGAIALFLAARQAAQQRAATAAKAGSEQAIFKNVADMVLVGDCDGAVATAIRAGKMDLAAQARAACKPVAEPYAPKP